MEESQIMPQNSRLVALLLGFIGGFVDVYCHIQFKTFVATQTGNIILLVADIGTSKADTIWIKSLSILTFSIGFLVGTIIKEKATTAHWRTVTMLPLLLSSFILPFVPNVAYLWVIVLAFSCGMVMVTFNGSKIESHPYTIMMTSGNYRKMISSWYHYLVNEEKTKAMKRQAVNYSLIVLVFVLGALIGAFADCVVHEYAIWGVGMIMLVIAYYYHHSIRKHQLVYRNL